MKGDPDKGHEWTKELHGSYRENEKSYRNIRGNPGQRCLRDAWYGLQIGDLVLAKYAVAKALVWEMSLSFQDDPEYLYEMVDLVREQEAHDRAMMKRSEEREKQEEVA